MRIRDYRPSDSTAVGRLIASTFGSFNLGDLPAEVQTRMLGPFAHAESSAPQHQQAISDALESRIVLVAEQRGDIVGVLRGGPDRLQSLFVSGAHHRCGMGRRLVERFEQRIGSADVRVAATLFAVPFYQSLGYCKTTGQRQMRIFGTEGFPYQPMRKMVGR